MIRKLIQGINFKKMKRDITALNINWDFLLMEKFGRYELIIKL